MDPTLYHPCSTTHSKLALNRTNNTILLAASQRLSTANVAITKNNVSGSTGRVSTPSHANSKLTFTVNTTLHRTSLNTTTVNVIGPRNATALCGSRVRDQTLRLTKLYNAPYGSLGPCFKRALNTSNIVRDVIAIRKLTRKDIFNIGNCTRYKIPCPLGVDTRRHAAQASTTLGATSKFNNYGTTTMFQHKANQGTCNASRANDASRGTTTRQDSIFNKQCYSKRGPTHRSKAGNTRASQSSTRGGHERRATNKRPKFAKTSRDGTTTGIKRGRYTTTGRGGIVAGTKRTNNSRARRVHATHSATRITVAQRPRVPFNIFVHRECHTLTSPGVGFSGVSSLYGLTCITSYRLLTKQHPSYPTRQVNIILTGHDTSLSDSVHRRTIVSTSSKNKTSPTIFICALPGVVLKRVTVGRKLGNRDAFFTFPSGDYGFVQGCTRKLVTRKHVSTII